MSTAEAAAIAANPDLQKALQKALALAKKAAADEAIAKDRADAFQRALASGAYDGPTGIFVGRFARQVSQRECMREDSRPVRSYAKIAKQSRQAATDAATGFVAALAASLAAK
jgi:hypothetical protein